MPKPVIIDCDPGHDDAIALLLAFSAPEILDILAITVVAGNQTLEKTLNNTLRVLSFAGLKSTVAAGYHKPLIRSLTIAPEVHGESGLEGPFLPEPSFEAVQEHAVEVIIREVRQSQEKVTLIPTGPLTNIAAALIGAPDLNKKIGGIVLMGGAAYEGNWTPAAEYNILVDPEAASFVFSSGIPITMIGLDVTHKAQVYDEDIIALKKTNKRVAIMVGELLEYYGKFHHKMGFKGYPLHDPLAVAVVMEPDLVKTTKYPVVVETSGHHTTGRTVVDFYGVTHRPPNVDVALEVQRDSFMELLFNAIQSYD